jgi:hypothetical protein
MYRPTPGLAAKLSLNAGVPVGARIVAAVGGTGARELLDVLTRSEADRAALIGRLSLRADAEWLAELLTDLEVDEVARLHLVEALRRKMA